jgi:hypothetical protein
MLRRVVPMMAVALLLVSCTVAPDRAVLATVGDTELRADYVQTLLPPQGSRPVQVAGEPTPLQAALDLAVRDELLAHEAQRRGLPGTTRAEQLAALLAAERAAHPDLDPAAIGDFEARTWYAAHRELFDEIATAEASWVEFAEEAPAREAFRRGSGQRSPLTDLVSASADVRGSGSASIDHDGGASEMVLRIVNAVRRPNGLGLDQEPETGSWFLVRVDAVTLEPTPWDQELADRVKSAMAWEREERHLAGLAESLRERWPVRTFPEHLQTVTE